MELKTTRRAVFLTLVATAGIAVTPAHPDTLDDVKERGVLRCAIVLDFPPIGYVGDTGEPAGFDVDYCRDLADSLSVEHEVVKVTWAERIPAVVDGRADVIFGSMSDTLERAQQVGFTVPYLVLLSQALVRKDAVIGQWDDLADKRVGSAASTFQEAKYLEIAKDNGWDTSGYKGYESEQALLDAIIAGDIDAALTTNALLKSVLRDNSHLEAGPLMPLVPDYCAVGADRKDVSWLNYLNLFVHHQSRSGRYAELWREHVGTEPPPLVVDGVYR